MSNPTDTHAVNLDRVRQSIGETVLAFIRAVSLTFSQEFTASELRAYVGRVHGSAPASPDRILRDLRQRGLIGYECVSRKESRYRVTSVTEGGV